MTFGTGTPLPGPYIPTLILHGGAGNITRKNLPPTLYDQFEASLLRYLDSTRQCLNSGASALDAAVHAVSLMEDDALFNCGRGSVFTEKGTIEMEASVMVASVDPERIGRDQGSLAAGQKRGASVSLIRSTRHPIQLAREVLLVKPNGKDSSMHCQLSGPDVEEWAWEEKGLEWKDDGWFWTKKRWLEHLRDLRKDNMDNGSNVETRFALADSYADSRGDENDQDDQDDQDDFLPSQGTVGAVCMDSWGDIAVATSTGGLTNKKVGRIGDTPTLGAGFWAESWDDSVPDPVPISSNDSEGRNILDEATSNILTVRDRFARALNAGFGDLLQDCFLFNHHPDKHTELPYVPITRASPNECFAMGDVVDKQPYSHPVQSILFDNKAMLSKIRTSSRQRHAVAISGTGNGDSFLRLSGCRTAAAFCRYSIPSSPSYRPGLATAVTMMAGSNGELQQSAGDRWKVSGEGEAGMIGIEVLSENFDPKEQKMGHCVVKQPRRTGTVVFDFNCGGLFRALVDEKTGQGMVMVFRESYYQNKDQRST